MSIIEFKKESNEAVCISEDFDIELDRELLIDWALKCKNKKDMDEFIVSLYNEGIIAGNCNIKVLAKERY